MRFFLFGISLLLSSSAYSAPNKVAFETRDHQKLKALYLKPQPGNPTVVCLHGLAAWKEEWTPLIDALSKKGWGVLAYDARGHGESSLSKDSQGSPNGFQSFGPPVPGSPWSRMVDDVGSAIQFVRSDLKQPVARIILAGASLGANVALTYASLTTSIEKVVLLSPGLDYAGFKTEEPMRKISSPVLLIASPADGYAYQSVQKLKQIQPKATLWTDVKPGHGAQMFDDKLLQRLISWLDQQKQ